MDDTLERLKPGRKKVKGTPSPESETPRDLENKEGASSVFGVDGSSTTRKRYPRAKQIAIDELQDLGLTAGDLRKLGVDVLNPEGVAKMLK